jgi:hypothetical protein
MSSNKAGRVLVAAALAAALFLAVPVQAMDGRGAPPGFVERLTAWFVETWDGLIGGAPATRLDDTQAPSTQSTIGGGEGDPEGCRGDYTACVDPNG